MRTCMCVCVYGLIGLLIARMRARVHPQIVQRYTQSTVELAVKMTLIYTRDSANRDVCFWTPRSPPIENQGLNGPRARSIT